MSLHIYLQACPTVFTKRFLVKIFEWQEDSKIYVNIEEEYKGYIIETASCMVFTISGSSVATSAGASPVAMAITFLAILRPYHQKFLRLAAKIALLLTQS